MSADTQRKEYICPGESYAISRSVHLARLASFFPTCRECPYRTETGQLPARTVHRLQQTERRIDRPTLFTAEGVRGVYINELSRAKAANITAAFASLLIEKTPLEGRVGPQTPKLSRRPPMVVVGFDQRPSSPDLTAGVVSALRRMGCAVVDIGPTTKPCLWFNVLHHQAAGGVLITGSGCDPSWTGLDFVDAGGRPISRVNDDDAIERSAEASGITLNRLEQLAARTVTRASRSAGVHSTFRGFAPYSARLARHFHALRPLRVVVGCPTRLVMHAVDRLFGALPCQLFPIDLPDRQRGFNTAEDADVARIAGAVASRRAHLGVLIDDDGLRCGFVDESGGLVSADVITRILARDVEPGETIVVEPSVAESMSTSAEDASRLVVAAESTLSAMFDGMQRRGAVFGGGQSGRFWFRDGTPTCDAILATASVLKSLSTTDAPFSEVATRFAN